MKGKLVKRIAFSVLAILALVLVSSCVAVVAAFRSRSVVQTLNQSLLYTRAAEELEISLLEQRGVAAAYLLDHGNPRRLAELPKAQDAFDVWLSKSRELTGDSNQQLLLNELESVYDRYIESRNKVVELFDNGEDRKATILLLDDVNRLYSEAYVVCEKIISNNEAIVDQAIRAVDRSTRLEFWLVLITVFASALLTAWLLRLLFSGILQPLRIMIQEASSFQLESGGLAVRSPDDELRAIGFYLQRLMSDVTDARSTLIEHRERLRHSESLASVGKLAACVAHEIRNPLTAIKMWLFSASQSLGNRTPQREMISKSLEELNRLEQVVQHFLEFARPPELRLERICINELIHRSLELAGPMIVEKEIRLDLKLPTESVSVEVDANQLTQVITNLLMNAVDASVPAQSIEIQLESRELYERQWQVIRITDFGTGISETNRERIFEPFFTTKVEGTGLGLCIAANIMGRLRGQLKLEPSDLRCTVFSVWIPTNGDHL